MDHSVWFRKNHFTSVIITGVQYQNIMMNIGFNDLQIISQQTVNWWQQTRNRSHKIVKWSQQTLNCSKQRSFNSVLWNDCKDHLKYTFVDESILSLIWTLTVLLRKQYRLLNQTVWFPKEHGPFQLNVYGHSKWN